MKNIKNYKSFINEGFGWGSITGGINTSAISLKRSSRNTGINRNNSSRFPHDHNRPNDNKEEITLHTVSQEKYGRDYDEIASHEKREVMEEYSRRTKGFKKDNAPTLHTVSQEKYGRDFDQLTDMEKKEVIYEFNKINRSQK